MSKDIEKLINIIHTGRKQKQSDKAIAIRIHVDGFRDITNLRDWLEERIKYLDSECETTVDTGTISLSWRNYEQG